MAGLLEMIKRMDPEQLRRLVQESGASTQQKPQYTPLPTDREGVDYFRPQIYDTEGYRLGEPVKIQPVPVYDQEGFRYVNPFEYNEEKRKGSLGGLLEQLKRLK
jgi:hypothetical protein